MGTSLEVADKTLQSSTQRGFRYTDNEITPHFHTRQAHMSHKHLRTPVYTDTLFNDIMSVWGNTCAQLFVSDNGHAKIYPMSSKGQAFDKLDSYCSTIGIPKFMISDNAGEETGGEWDRVRKKYLFQQRTTEPHSPWQNRAEREIQELKRHFRRIKHRSRCPERFWDYGME